MNGAYLPKQNQVINFKTEAWYMAGSTIFSTVKGNLIVTGSLISFIDETGNNVFTFSFSDIQKVILNPSQFRFKTSSRNYLVSLFDLKKFSLQMGIGGLFTMGLGIRNVNAANEDAIKLENIIKSQGVTTLGLKTNVGYKRLQRKSAILSIIFLIVSSLAAGIVLSLANRH